MNGGYHPQNYGPPSPYGFRPVNSWGQSAYPSRPPANSTSIYSTPTNQSRNELYSSAGSMSIMAHSNGSLSRAPSPSRYSASVGDNVQIPKNNMGADLTRSVQIARPFTENRGAVPNEPFLKARNSSASSGGTVQRPKSPLANARPPPVNNRSVHPVNNRTVNPQHGAASSAARPPPVPPRVVEEEISAVYATGAQAQPVYGVSAKSSQRQVVQEIGYLC